MSTPGKSTPGAQEAVGGSTDWSQERERSHLWALQLMRWIALVAGRRLTRWVLHPIALYFVVANGKARRASRQYLSRVRGRPATWAEVYRHIHHFSATVLDRIYFLQERFELFDVAVTHKEVMHAPLDRGEGVLGVGAHLGSFEALRANAQLRGEKVAMLMYEGNARLINATLAAVAPQATMHTIPLGQPGAMLKLRRWLDDGGIGGLLADRTLPAQSGRSRNLRLNFLGATASFSDGPFRLAAMLRRRMVFMVGLYHGDNRYELRFVELAHFGEVSTKEDTDRLVRQAVERYAALLESLCRESPYNWFNFYDFWSVDADAAEPAPPAPST